MEAFPVFSGWIFKKRHASLSSWKRRWCILRQDTITYYEDSSEKHLKGIVMLQHGIVTATDQYHFHIEITNGRIYYMKAETITEANDWVTK